MVHRECMLHYAIWFASHSYTRTLKKNRIFIYNNHLQIVWKVHTMYMHSTQKLCCLLHPRLTVIAQSWVQKMRFMWLRYAASKKSNKERIRKRMTILLSTFQLSRNDVLLVIINARQRRAYLRDFRFVGFWTSFSLLLSSYSLRSCLSRFKISTEDSIYLFFSFLQFHFSTWAFHTMYTQFKEHLSSNETCVVCSMKWIQFFELYCNAMQCNVLYILQRPLHRRYVSSYNNHERD